MSLVGKARARPDQVKKVLETVQQQGALTTYKKAMNRLDSYSPLGYSLAGVVEEVGKGAEEFSVGQLVACAGNEFALHAEINWVPTNLCVAVPDGVSPQLAAFATVGSIALQGVRQGNVQIGDTACVIGLGLVGQLVVQLLVASGVQVVGLDPDQDRCRLAEKAGALLCAAPDDDGRGCGGTGAVQGLGWARCRPGLPGRGRLFQPAGGAGGTARTRPGDGRRHRQVQARLAVERLLREGARPPVLPLVRTGPLRPQLRGRRNRLPGRATCDGRSGAISTASSMPWPERRSIPSRSSPGSFPSRDAPSVYEQLSTGVLQGVGFLFEYDAPEEADLEGPSHSQAGACRRRPVRRSGDRLPAHADPPWTA